jgi:hypothetical protein
MITSGAGLSQAYVGGTWSLAGRLIPPNVVAAQAAGVPPVPVVALALPLLDADDVAPVVAVDDALLALPPALPPVPPAG